MSEERLARIEAKVDNLAEAMVMMALIEELMVNIFNRMDRYDDAQAKLDTKLSAIEKTSIKRGVVELMFDKAFWIVGGGIVAWYFKK